MAQLAIGETQFTCAPLTISANNDGCWKDFWESKDGESVCVYSVLLFAQACLMPFPPIHYMIWCHMLVCTQLSYGYQKWAPNCCWLSRWVINLWSGHWETTKMPTVLCWLFHETHQFVLWVFERTRRNCTCFNSSPHHPLKPEWAVLWFFNFQKTRTRGLLLTKSNTHCTRLVCTAWIHLSNQSSAAISSHLKAFSLEAWGWGSWGKFIFEKV